MLKGMFAEDAGGPYRECLFQMCRELQSPVLPLFLPCPNARDQVGKNRECYIPNPAATSMF
jgi:E3 ubiquitin-protein ligase HERC2